MTMTIRRFIYVYNPLTHQEEEYFPTGETHSRENYIWLITKAARLHPLGFALAQFVWLHKGNLKTLESRFKVPRQVLDIHLAEFFTTLEQLSIAEEN